MAQMTDRRDAAAKAKELRYGPALEGQTWGRVYDKLVVVIGEDSNVEFSEQHEVLFLRLSLEPVVDGVLAGTVLFSEWGDKARPWLTPDEAQAQLGAVDDPIRSGQLFNALNPTVRGVIRSQMRTVFEIDSGVRRLSSQISRSQLASRGSL